MTIDMRCRKPAAGMPAIRVRERAAARLAAAVAVALMLVGAGCSEAPFDECAHNGLICPPGRCPAEGDTCLETLGCGNGIIDPGEACDCGSGTVAPIEAECAGRQNDMRGGWCRADCRLHCGDGELNDEETCDGTVQRGSCIDDEVFDRRVLGCDAQTCRADTAQCGIIGWRDEIVGRDNYFAVWGSSRDNIFAVREVFGEIEGPIMRYDGQRWRAETLPQGVAEKSLFAVWGSGASDVFAVGEGGAITHYDGEVWTAMDLPAEDAGQDFLNGVWGSGPMEPVFAVGASGRIYRYHRDSMSDPATWEWRREYKTGNYCGAAQDRDCALVGIWGSGPDRYTAIGNQVLVRFDGDSWSEEQTLERYWVDAWGSDGAGRDNVFIVGGDYGDGSVILHRGQPWPEKVEAFAGALESVWGLTSSDVIAVGRAGAILHYDGNEAGSWSLLDSEVPVRLEGVWSDGASALTAVGWNGNILRYGGQSWLKDDIPTDLNLSDVEAQSPQDVYFIYQQRRVYRFDGDDFHVEETGATGTLRGVFAGRDGQIYAVGQSSSIVRRDPGSGDGDSAGAWTPRTVEAGAIASRLVAGWVSPAGVVFAVGWRTGDGVGEGASDEAGTIFRCDAAGGVCRQEDPGLGPGQSLSAVWGCSEDDVMAVGLHGAITRYSGGAWRPDAIGIEHSLHGVWGSTCDDVYVVGDGGMILHYDGAEWRETASGTAEDLRDVWGLSPCDIYAVGFSGTILHYDGRQWSPVRSNTRQRLLAVSGAANRAKTSWSVVFAGESGTLLRLLRTDVSVCDAAGAGIRQ